MGEEESEATFGWSFCMPSEVGVAVGVATTTGVTTVGCFGETNLLTIK